MKNPMLARALGESSDVVPVVATLPRATFRDRQERQRTRRNEEEADDSIQRMVGEAEERIIPDHAEDVSATEMTVGKPLRPTKDVVLEPSHPTADKEKYLTPFSALVAPDVTPQSTQPIDPSRVPGAKGSEKFTVADLGRAQEVAPEYAPDNNTVNPLDIILGRGRAPKAASQPADFQAAGAVTTEEQAAALLGITTPIQEEASVKASSVLVSSLDGGAAMPPPPPASNGSAIYSAFRRFNG